jgi:hypothetical protein
MEMCKNVYRIIINYVEFQHRNSYIYFKSYALKSNPLKDRYFSDH